MSTIPTIPIHHLASSSSLAEALSSWRGFAELAPPAQSRQGRPYAELGQDADDWTWHHVPAATVPAIGCYFLQDLEICGSGYPFHAGRFVHEGVHTSDAALEWLADPAFHDHPITRPPANTVTVDQPVLMVFGPGSSIYGHWLLDFLPRIAIAQQLLGAAMDDFVIPLPADTPAWATAMMETFCGIAPGRILPYHRQNDRLRCAQVCLPSFAHNGKYVLHPFMRAFYDRFGKRDTPTPKRRICVSRRNQERETFSYRRIFERRETMERLAEDHGFTVVRPEELSFADQVALFRSASCVLGEVGSALHASVFCDPGTTVAIVGWISDAQYHITAAFEQQMVLMSRIQEIEDAAGDSWRFTAMDVDLKRLLEMITA
jgi:capsular polysaccharide biosynthesis protein